MRRRGPREAISRCRCCTRYLAVNADGAMRIPFVIVAALTMLWSGLLTASLAQQSNGAGASNPLPQAEASPDDIEGGKLFATTCGWCHSDGGRTAGKGPQLMDTKRDDDFLRNRIKNGKSGAMPAFASMFSDAQIDQIIKHIRELKPSVG